MKKIVALAVGAALVGGGLAACWYTGNSFDNIMAEQIAKVEKRVGSTCSGSRAAATFSPVTGS